MWEYEWDVTFCGITRRPDDVLRTTLTIKHVERSHACAPLTKRPVFRECKGFFTHALSLCYILQNEKDPLGFSGSLETVQQKTLVFANVNGPIKFFISKMYYMGRFSRRKGSEFQTSKFQCNLNHRKQFWSEIFFIIIVTHFVPLLWRCQFHFQCWELEMELINWYCIMFRDYFSLILVPFFYKKKWYKKNLLFITWLSQTSYTLFSI